MAARGFTAAQIINFYYSSVKILSYSRVKKVDKDSLVF